MQYVLIAFFLFFPLSLFAAVPQTTQEYLTRSGTDPWVVMARAAVGVDTGSPAVARESVFALAKTILALVASGKNPRSVGGEDLIDLFLRQHVRDGQIGESAFAHDDFWGLMALRAAGVFADHLAITNARDFILHAQQANGGWSYTAAPDFPDTDDTAAAIMALRSADVPASDVRIQRAFSYLREKQNADGGFPNVPPGASSVDSTAWVAMALQKAGLDVSRARTFLESKMRDDGSWGSPATTSFAAIALSDKWFPVVPATIRVDVAETMARGPAPLHPAPTASVRDLLGLERGPRNVSPLAPDDSSVVDTSAIVGGAKAVESAILPIGFVFPSVIATSVFSKPEKVAVVYAEARENDKIKESQNQRITKIKNLKQKKKNIKKNVKKKNHR